MKRLMSLFLLILAFCLVICPVLAEGDSMSEPVEIIGTVPGTEPPTPPDTTTKSPEPENHGDSEENWSLVNLICAALATGFGGLATREAFKTKGAKTEITDGDKKYTVVRKDKKVTENGAEVTKTEFISKSALWKTGYYDLTTSAASIVTFLLTQNIQTHMTLVDKWTPLMAAFAAVSIVVERITGGGKQLGASLVEKLLTVKPGASDGGKS